MLLSRDAILNAKDIKIEKVEVPEWGGHVFVKALTAGERDKYEASLFETKRDGKKIEVLPVREDIRARLVAISVVDESGKLMFTPADVEVLTKKSASAMDRVFSMAKRINRFSNEDMEELEKNSKGEG